MSIQTTNAKIESTMLGVEDHGILTCYLGLDYGGHGQSFGGYAFDKHNGVRGTGSERLGTAYGMEFIRRILETVGVEKWEDLKGKLIRVKYEHHKVHAIGHIIEDKWFTPESAMRDFLEATP